VHSFFKTFNGVKTRRLVFTSNQLACN